MVLFSEHNFLGKIKKLAPKWLGHATIIETMDTNVKIKCSNNKIKLLNVSLIKHFVLDKSSLKTNVYSEEENFEPPTSQSPPSFDWWNNPPNHPLTCSLTRLLHEQHSINFVMNDLRDKLTTICEKLYRYDVPFSSLTPDDQLLWWHHVFLTGDQNFVPEYTKFNQISCSPQNLQPQQHHPIVPQPQNQPDPVLWPQHHAVINAWNIIEGPRTRHAKNLAHCLLYLKKKCQ